MGGGRAEETDKIRLVLADEHPLILEGLEHLFGDRDGVKVLALCSDGEAALTAVRQQHPDVLVLGQGMLGADGVEVARTLLEEAVTTRIVVLAGDLDERQALEYLRIGVAGIVLKEMPSCLVSQCVRKVAAGDVWVERRSFCRAMEHLLRREAGAQRMASRLTPRELEVVRLCAQGATNAEIAAELSVTEGTVKSHLHKVYQKLDVRDRTDLTRFAFENGLI